MSEKKTYVFRFDVVESWKASFEASSDEEAARLFKELTGGDLNGDDLPEYVEKNSGIDTEYYVLEDAAGKVIEVEED
jgi:hypothetical protein